MNTAYPSIRLHPSGRQFVVQEGFTTVCVCLLFIAVGYEGLMPESVVPYMLGLVLLTVLFLVYRYLYITRMVYIISAEQLKYEFGIFSTTKDYIELYRVVDYGEQRSFLQILLGLKTVSVYSGDRTRPRLDIIGIPDKMNLINTIRERVEINKTRRNIHEFTNTK